MVWAISPSSCPVTTEMHMHRSFLIDKGLSDSQNSALKPSTAWYGMLPSGSRIRMPAAEHPVNSLTTARNSSSRGDIWECRLAISRKWWDRRNAWSAGECDMTEGATCRYAAGRRPPGPLSVRETSTTDSLRESDSRADKDHEITESPMPDLLGRPQMLRVQSDYGRQTRQSQGNWGCPCRP